MRRRTIDVRDLDDLLRELESDPDLAKIKAVLPVPDEAALVEDIKKIAPEEATKMASAFVNWADTIDTLKKDRPEIWSKIVRVLPTMQCAIVDSSPVAQVLLGCNIAR